MEKENNNSRFYLKKSASTNNIQYSTQQLTEVGNSKKYYSARYLDDENSSISTFSSSLNASASGLYTHTTYSATGLSGYTSGLNGGNGRKPIGVAKLSDSIVSLAEFKLGDTHPSYQREVLYRLSLNNSRLIHEGRIKILPKDAQRGKKEYSLKPKSRTINRINAFLSKKKSKKSRQENFHLLYLAVWDHRTSQALSILEDLSSNTLRKKNYFDANRIFLLAMVNNLESVVIAMLEKGFPPNVNTPIFELSMSQDFKLVLPSYFILAVALGLENVTKIMIKKAYINQTWNGLTPLHIACCRGEEKLINLILDYGADPFQPLPLEQYYVLGQLKSLEAQIISHKNGVLNHTYIDNQLGTPKEDYSYSKMSQKYLTKNVLYPIDIAAATGNLKIASILINKIGIDGLKRSRLCLILQQQYNMSMLLLKYGASFPQIDAWHNTPLHIASRQGNLKLVIVYSSLLNINTPGQNGWTPLHEALTRNHKEVCQYLLKKGASINSRNNENLTPKELAERFGVSRIDIESCLDQTTEFLVEGEISEKEILSKLSRYLSNLSIINNSKNKQMKKKNQILFPKVFQ